MTSTSTSTTALTKNCALYANQTGAYDELLAYLRRRR